MLRYAAIFAVLAVAAAIAGASGLFGVATELALILGFVFALVAVVTFILGLLKQ